MKRSLTGLLVVMTLGSSMIGFSAQKRQPIRKKKDNFSKEMVNKNIEDYRCGNKIVKVEYNGDNAKVTDENGTHFLKIGRSGSGVSYLNNNGVSVHTKGNTMIYTPSLKSEDVICTKISNAEVNNRVENFKYKGKNVKVEYLSEDTIKVTDFKRKKHILKRVKSASGESFSNLQGVNLHYKGNSGILVLNEKEYILTK